MGGLRGSCGQPFKSEPLIKRIIRHADGIEVAGGRDKSLAS